MNKQKTFTRKSFLQRFVISQFLLSAVILGIIAISNQRPRQQVKMDVDKIASKIASPKAGVTANVRK